MNIVCRNIKSELGEREAVINTLLEQLTDENSDVRGRAAYALGELGKGSQTVVDALLKTLTDEDSDVRGGLPLLWVS